MDEIESNNITITSIGTASRGSRDILKHLGLLVGLSVLAIVIRALFSPWQPTFPDSFTYLKHSECISNGSLYIEQWVNGPRTLSMTKSLYALLISGISSQLSGIFDKRETAATLLSVISGGLLIIPVFYLGKVLFGKTTAWIGAALVLINPYLIQFSGWILTESLFTFLFITCISLTIIMLTRGWPSYLWVLTGLLSGLLYLSRELGILVFPMVILWIIFYQLLTKKVGFWKTGQLLIFLVLGFLIIYFPAKKGFSHISAVMQHAIEAKERPVEKEIVPVEREIAEDKGKISLGVRLGSMVESFIFTTDLKNPQDYERLNARLTPDGSGYQPSKEQKSPDAHVIKVLWEKKLVLIEMVWKSIGRYAVVFWDSFSVILIIFLVIGLFIQPKFFLLSWATVYLGLLIISGSAYFAFGEFELRRYMMPLFPIFFLWVGHGVYMGGNWLIRGVEKAGLSMDRRKVQSAGAVIFTIIVLTTFLTQAKYLRLYTGNQRSTSRMVGEEIKKRSPNPPLVMARTPAIPYYAGGSFLMTPYDPYERVLEFARKRGVDFIVITQGDGRPLLRNLLSIKAPKPGIKFEFGIRDRRNPEGLILAVYRVLDNR